MNNVLEQALIVIDERDFERSLRAILMCALCESGAKLHAELEAEVGSIVRSPAALHYPKNET